MIPDRMQGDGTEPIADEERIFRRIPVRPGWYVNGELDARVFRPREDDETGISISRNKYKTAQEAAQGTSPHGYYVAVFQAGTLRANGFQLEPRPLENDPGHAEIVDLNYENAKSSRCLDLMERLTKLSLGVEGPFHCNPP